MKQNINLQDNLLNLVRTKEIPVTIYLINGFQLNGKVKGFDNFTIIIHSESKDQMVYKHAISTIKPHENVEGIFASWKEE